MTPDAVDSPAGAIPASSRSRPQLDARQVGAFVLALTLIFTLSRLASHNWDSSSFVRAGDKMTHPDTPGLTVIPDSLGYDGQFFHRLARDPFSAERRQFGTILDRPAYRQARIGYPLAVWVLTGGGRFGVTWGLIAVNVAAVTAAGFLAARLAEEAGKPAAWGLLVAGWPGLMVALSYDLSEALAAALLLASLLALRRRQWPAAALWLTAAALTRETTLLLAAGVVGSWLLARLPRPLAALSARFGFVDQSPTPLWVGLMPMAVAGGYRLALARRWSGAADFGPEIPSFVGIPLKALVSQLNRWLLHGDGVDWYQMVQVVLVIIVVVVLASTLRDRQAGLAHERLALAAAAVGMTMLPNWDRAVVFLRWADEVVVFGFVVALGARRFPIRPIAKLVAALSLTTALVWVAL